jgi:hypothetical protein
MLNWQQDCYTGDCTYVHTIKHRRDYQLRYTQKNTACGNVFRFMKSEELMAGEDSEPEGTCSKLAGTHFTIGKIKF